MLGWVRRLRGGFRLLHLELDRDLEWERDRDDEPEPAEESVKYDDLLHDRVRDRDLENVLDLDRVDPYTLEKKLSLSVEGLFDLDLDLSDDLDDDLVRDLELDFSIRLRKERDIGLADLSLNILACCTLTTRPM